MQKILRGWLEELPSDWTEESLSGLCLGHVTLVTWCLEVSWTKRESGRSEVKGEHDHSPQTGTNEWEGEIRARAGGEELNMFPEPEEQVAASLTLQSCYY